MNIDLEIDNYDLKDLINLFQISYDFGENELRKAKRIVLRMHPDKSGLDKKYFLFFSSAYKIMHAIYQFRFRTTDNCTEYKSLDDKKNDEIVKNLLNNKIIKKDFNRWFNELFEKTKIGDEYSDNGYGDWLKSDEDLEEFKNIAKQDIDKTFEEKKKKVQSLTVHKDFTENQTNQYELSRDKPEYYSSDLFSKLNFEDLKRAHIESVIPVTQEDYINSKKFNNLEEIRSDRSKKIAPSSLNQAKEFLRKQTNKQTDEDIHRAYKLVRQDEKIKDANDIWWSNIKQLK